MTEIVPYDDMVKETGKAFGQETAAQVFGFISDILRPPAQELGGLLKDQVSFFRWKNQIKLLKKAKEIQEQTGIPPQKVPLKLVAKVLEQGSWEEDETMQAKWAALLANAATEGTPTDNHVVYAELLDQLTPIQAHCLDIMYQEVAFPARKLSRSLPSFKAAYTLKELLGVETRELNIILDNLIRLNLATTKLTSKDPIGFDTSEVETHRSYEEVSLTYLGQELIKMCRVPINAEQKQKIIELLESCIEDIAKDHDGPRMKYFAAETDKIYEHLSERDAECAVSMALNQYIWNGRGPIKDFEGEHLDPELKAKIIESAMTHFELLSQ